MMIANKNTEKGATENSRGTHPKETPLQFASSQRISGSPLLLFFLLLVKNRRIPSTANSIRQSISLSLTTLYTLALAGVSRMDCHAIGLIRGCLDKQLPCFPWVPVKSHFTDVTPVKHNLAFVNSSSGSHRHLSPISIGRYRFKFSRSLCMSVGIEEHSSSIASEDGNVDKDSSEETLVKPLSSNQLKSLLADSERAKLVKKLSEANQQNRFLKRQLLSEEDALVNFKSELAVVELELQALVALAEEITKYGVPKGSRKINGKYIQSHLLSRLEAVQEKIKDQIKDVEVAQPKEVPLFWVGMAESVQVMGSFDGWSQGEHLSPEYTGSFARFSTTLRLRPGRYEIKFLVDGQWHLSPEFPTVGEGLTENNLLVVE
ncbi:hypothetical protein V2J09_001689 [Rumex salicifolius]